jgi:DNA-binding NtrC family response regulator
MPMTVRVLVVDDEEPMLRSIERLMRGRSLEMHFTSDPGQALSIVAEHKIDIVLADFVMPGLTGIALLKEAKLRFPGITRVLMSGSIDRQAAIDAVNEGGVERMIEKPWPQGELQRVLLELAADVLARRSKVGADPKAALKSFKR